MDSFEIQTITPVHIGNGRFLQAKTEYVFGKELIGIVDEEKVLKLIGEDRIANWVLSIEEGKSLVKFLSDYGIKPNLPEISSRNISIQCDKDQARVQTSLKEQLFNGMGLPYIPGSSIKGSIRSAIYNEEIRKMGRPLKENEILAFGKIKGALIEKKLFGNDPNHDLFRFLQIGDAYFKTNTTVALNLVNINIKQTEVRLDSSKNQLLEAIGKKNFANFSMKLNQSALDSNVKYKSIEQYPSSFASLEALFKTINSNSRILIEEEIEFWNDYESDDSVSDYQRNLGQILKEISSCTEKECVLRVGHGSGYVFISGNLIKNSDYISDENYDLIVNAARPGNERRYKDYPFPKSRRIDENVDLLGFVKIIRNIN